MASEDAESPPTAVEHMPSTSTSHDNGISAPTETDAMSVEPAAKSPSTPIKNTVSDRRLNADALLEYALERWPTVARVDDLADAIVGRRASNNSEGAAVADVAAGHAVADTPAAVVDDADDLPLILIDGETCLQRLYGGLASDWASGGQWTRMLHFVRTLADSFVQRRLRLAVVFDGTMCEQRFHEWRLAQLATADTVRQVYKQIRMRCVAPPKSHWTPPRTLRYALRLALGHCDVGVHVTVVDHRQEVVRLCDELHAHALLGGGGEYLFMRPRLLHAVGSSLRLMYKLSRLEALMIDSSALMEHLAIAVDRLPLLGALLGTHILPAKSLRPFHDSLVVDIDVPAAVSETLIDGVTAAVSETLIDGVTAAKSDRRSYMTAILDFVRALDDDGANATSVARIVSTFYDRRAEDAESPSAGDQRQSTTSAGDHQRRANTLPDAEQVQRLFKESVDYFARASSSSSSTTLDVVDDGEQVSVAPLTMDDAPSSSTSSPAGETDRRRPRGVHAKVLEVARRRHAIGLMHPWIHQLLTTGELRVPAGLDDHGALPSAASVWRPVRQAVYGVLFDLHHKDVARREHRLVGDNDDTTSTAPSVSVREWTYERNHALGESMEVPAVLLVSKGMPTLHSLWFRDGNDRRLRIFLACLRSEHPLMLHSLYVPRHLLLLVCVLRYLCSHRLLTLAELDSVLATALSIKLVEAERSQSQAPISQRLTTRGVHLAQLVMSGVEHAIVVNDACGAPLPPSAVAPWTFFDGRALQTRMAMAANGASLMHLCHANVAHMAQVERLRQAVILGVEARFLQTPAMPIMQHSLTGHAIPPMTLTTTAGNAAAMAQQAANAIARAMFIAQQQAMRRPPLGLPPVRLPPAVVRVRAPTPIAAGVRLNGVSSASIRPPRRPNNMTMHSPPDMTGVVKMVKGVDLRAAAFTSGAPPINLHVPPPPTPPSTSTPFHDATGLVHFTTPSAYPFARPPGVVGRFDHPPPMVPQSVYPMTPTTAGELPHIGRPPIVLTTNLSHMNGHSAHGTAGFPADEQPVANGGAPTVWPSLPSTAGATVVTSITNEPTTYYITPTINAAPSLAPS